MEKNKNGEGKKKEIKRLMATANPLQTTMNKSSICWFIPTDS